MDWNSVTQKQKIDLIYTYYHARTPFGEYWQADCINCQFTFNLAKRAFKLTKPSQEMCWKAHEIYWRYCLYISGSNQCKGAAERLKNNKVNVSRASITKWVKQFPNGCALPEYLWDEYASKKR